MALLIEWSGNVRDVRPASGEKFTLEELQGYVEGYIETVSVPGAVGVLLLADEDGLTKEPALAVNNVASRLANQTLVGPVLLVSAKEFD